jgi:hypothetical protein
MEKKIQIPAVHDKDLRSVLDRFGLADKIDSGAVHCYNCDKLITWENLFAIKVVDSNVVVFCEEPDCIEKSSK